MLRITTTNYFMWVTIVLENKNSKIIIILKKFKWFLFKNFCVQNLLGSEYFSELIFINALNK